MRAIIITGAVALSVLAVAPARAATVTLTATLTESITPQGAHYYDNMLRSYQDPNTVVNGFMKFDLSGIADNAIINSVSLKTILDSSFGSPANSPRSAIYLVSDDSWTKTSGNPALTTKVSPTYGAFPTTSGSAMNWAIASSAVSANLADNVLSLAMHGEAGYYSYVYFFGAQNTATAPTLTIDYSLASSAVPEPATWAMMIAGFGLVGGTLRRRRPAVAVAA